MEHLSTLYWDESFAAMPGVVMLDVVLQLCIALAYVAIVGTVVWVVVLVLQSRVTDALDEFQAALEAARDAEEEVY